ncbi:MAG: FG-GAP-like repeat-containing protein, partial [bacterium]
NYSNNCKYDEVLGKWNVESIDSSAYIVRLKVYGTNGQESQDKVILNVIHHPTEIKHLSLIKRIDGNRYRYIIKLMTSDPVSAEVHYRKASTYVNTDDRSQFRKISSLSITDDHEIYMPKEIEPGKYEYFIIATTMSGFVTIDDNNGKYYIMDITWAGIPSSGFIKNKIGIPAVKTLSINTDINMNKIPEIICMESTNWEYSPLLIYEKIDGSYKAVFRSEMSFLPVDIGDSDNDGLMEILGRNFDGSVLFECPFNGQFPSRKIWEVNGIRAVKFADLDMDGKKEIIARKINTGDVQIYENRGNNSYLRVATLQNPSDGINYLMVDPAVSDFDNDGFNEIVIGDIDGDIYIYENIYDDYYKIVWKYKCEEYIQNISKGDFDGDGISEFIISTIDHKSYDLKAKRWIHTVFKFDGHTYSNYWSFEISSTEFNCFINIGDLDGDKKEEIVFVDTGYIYGISLHDGAKNVLLTNRKDKPLIDDFNGDGVADIILNDKDELIFYSIDSSEIIKSPWNIYARPLNEHEIELRWNGPFESNAFRIYRGIGDKELLPIKTLYNRDLQNFAVLYDKNLIEGEKYTYAISSINADGQESILSEKVTVIPNAPPKLLSVKFLSPNILYLYFNEAMGELAKDKDRYIISNGSGEIFIPSSAILDIQGKRVVLTISGLKSGTYKVKANEINDSTGVYISSEYNSTEFEVSIPEIPVYSDLSSIRVYPNPVRTGSRHYARVIFDNIPLGSVIKIYDLIGQLIKEFEVGYSSTNRVMWFLDNANDKKIASGIYIYLIEFNGNVKSGKIAVVR